MESECDRSVWDRGIPATGTHAGRRDSVTRRATGSAYVRGIALTIAALSLAGAWMVSRSANAESSAGGPVAGQWTLAEAVTPSDVRLSALVSERPCAGGRSPLDRILPPVIEEDVRSVTITILITPLPGVQTCIGHLPVPYEIQLPTPLGNRELRDGGVEPSRLVASAPTGTPATSPPAATRADEATPSQAPSASPAQAAATPMPDPGVLGARYLAETHGGSESDYELVKETEAVVPETGERLWAAKYVRLTTEQTYPVYRDARGTFLDAKGFAALSRDALAARPTLEQKAEPALLELIARAPDSRALLKVGLFLRADEARLEVALRAARARVAARYPHMRWNGHNFEGGRTLPEVRWAGDELYTAKFRAFDEVQKRVGQAVAASGGRVGYASTSTPLLFAELSATGLRAIAESPEVIEIAVSGSKWEETP